MEYFDGNLVAALKKPAKVCQATRRTKEQWDEVVSPAKKRALRLCFQAEPEMASLPVHNWLVRVAGTR